MLNGLKQSNGDWVTNPILLELMVEAYFQPMFQKEERGIIELAPPANLPSLSEESIRFLGKPFSLEETKKALFDIGPFNKLGLLYFYRPRLRDYLFFYLILKAVCVSKLLGFIVEIFFKNFK